MRLLACLIVAPQRGYDEPAILSYAISSFCPTSADGLHILFLLHCVCPLLGGEFNESTQHLLILADEEVCEWRGMHGHGSRRNRRLSCGSAGRAVNVWRTSRERLRGGTRAASIGSWLAMEGLLQRHAGGLW